MRTRVAGNDFELTAPQVERAMSGVDPEPIQEHYVLVRGRRFPPKQVLAQATDLDRADFTTHQARRILQRLGFAAYRRGTGGSPIATAAVGPHGGAEAALLSDYRGRWVAQDGLEVLFDAESPEAVLKWLRRHGRKARVWRVPAGSGDTGSSLVSP